jgi:hypothetical protein
MPRGVRHLLREFTATAVREHLRSQVEDASSPQLTKNEIELVRFIQEAPFDWNEYLGRSSTD